MVPERSGRAPSELRTDRLVLRRWRATDRAPFALINADPEVMEMFQAPLPTDESDALAARIDAHFDAHGFGLWALDATEDAGRRGSSFLGFVGIAVAGFDAPFTPCVEIGWRLARDAWGRGYATEAAHEVARCAFEDVGLAEVLSFTALDNHRSRQVMERIGMTHDPADDFDHPGLPAGHRLERHVLYRLTVDLWRARERAARHHICRSTQ